MSGDDKRETRTTGEWPREWTGAEKHLATEQRLQRKLLEAIAADRLIDRVAMSHLTDRVSKLEHNNHDRNNADREIRARVDHIERLITVPVEGRKRRRPFAWLWHRPLAIVAALVLTGGIAIVAFLFTTRSS